MEIKAKQLAHIQKDHDANGVADHSMTNPDDVTKMGYILDSADKIAEGGFSTAYSNFINGKNRFAKTALYQKDIEDDITMWLRLFRTQRKRRCKLLAPT